MNFYNNKNENYPFRSSINNMNLNDIEKIKIYKEQIKELKLLNEKLKKMETFSGQLKNFDEFISLLNQALFDYRPKKKEQKDALNKLIEVMNNHRL